MKINIKIVFGIGFFIFNSLSHAQIVLDITDLPKPNEVQVTTIVDSSMASVLSPGNSGANVSWDFNNLNYCCEDFKNYRWTYPQNSINSAFFPEANIALKTQCYFYHNTTTHVVTEICDYRDFFIKDSTGLNYFGSDFPNPHKTGTYRNIFPLLTYGQSKTNNCRIVIQQSPDSMIVRNIKDTVKADAWGSIITSFGTYNAIRYYTKEAVTDSLYINGSGELLRYMPTNYYYKWYTKGLGFPVFQISKGILETSDDYPIARVARYKWLETSIANISKKDINYSVFPNPITNESVLSFESDKSSTVIIKLTNITGQQLALFTDNFSSGKHIISLNDLIQKDLLAGVYFITITLNGENKVLKLMKG
ncbi:MAG: T9SS type A sorting domain-containing protein [Bacteroidales bacterium]